MDTIIEYYYDNKEKLWRIDVKDEEGNIVEYSYVSKYALETELKDFKNKYKPLSCRKTDFYK